MLIILMVYALSTTAQMSERRGGTMVATFLLTLKEEEDAEGVDGVLGRRAVTAKPGGF